MKFSVWKIWLRSLPWTMKWFVILVFLRPLVDSLYFLKNISPLLSPLYIVGTLTPILIIWSIQKMPKSRPSKIDRTFNFFAFFVAVGIAFLVLYDPSSLTALEMLLKLSLPIFLFYYLRRFIRNLQDLEGLMQTFLYSAIFVAGILLFEVAFGAIRIEESRGFDRIQGSFGDVVSYSIYILFSFLIFGYFFLKAKRKKMDLKVRRNILIVSGICVIGLFNIHHVASYIIFAALVGLFFLFNLRSDQGSTFLIGIVAIVLFFIFGQDLVEDRILPLISTDQRVFEGDLGFERLAHGRVGRWQNMLQLYTEQNIFVQLIGYPASMNTPYAVVSSGAHNDFVRILFLSGYLGLIGYIALLYRFYKRTMKQVFSIRFLALGTLAILVLFSMSITPTYYPPFMYIVMAIVAFVSLPLKRKRIIHA